MKKMILIEIELDKTAIFPGTLQKFFARKIQSALMALSGLGDAIFSVVSGRFIVIDVLFQRSVPLNRLIVGLRYAFMCRFTIFGGHQ